MDIKWLFPLSLVLPTYNHNLVAIKEQTLKVVKAGNVK